MKTSMFKRLRFAFLLLPILSVAALAGCTAQVGMGAPEDSTAQTEQLTQTGGNAVVSVAGQVDQTSIALPVQPVTIGQHHAKPQTLPVNPDQVEDGTPIEPDPSPWVENPGGSDPDPSPWMQPSTSAPQTR
ncbi:hypothetical protein BH09MYX1_BH09MYX1_11820 [soil metagenome]